MAFPSGNKGAADKSKEKFTSEEIIYIASFVDQNGGNPKSRSWDEIAKKPLLQHLQKTGEWFKALWELKVTDVLNKQCRISASNTGKLKLTKAEEAIMSVVQGNVTQSTHTFLQGAASTSCDNTNTTPANDADKYLESATKRPADPFLSTSTKRQKLTSLQVQKDGLKAIVDGNETLAYLTDLLTESSKNSELAVVAQTEAIKVLSKEIKSAIKDGSENISNNIRLIGDRICSTMFKIHELKTKAYLSPKKDSPFDDLADLEQSRGLYYENGEVDFHRVPVLNIDQDE